MKWPWGRRLRAAGAYSSRPLRLGLITTLDLNIGDDFIRESIVHIMQEMMPDRSMEVVAVDKLRPHTVYPRWHPIRSLHKDHHGPLPPAGALRRVAERSLPRLGFSRLDSCDIVIQCGAPIIWQDCRRSKWADLIWRDVVARLAVSGKLILNLAGGSGYPWERAPSTMVSNADEEFVRLMLGASHLTTVRDRHARDMLASLGHDAIQLCCPAMVLGQKFTQPTTPTRKVLINFMMGGGMFDWNQGVDEQAWERTMHDVLTDLRVQGWEPLFLAHEQYEFDLAAQRWPALPRIHPANRHEYFATVRDAAFGIFNRMHASVASAGLGVPSLAIGTDYRLFMVEALGLPILYTKKATRESIAAAVNVLVSQRDAESKRLLALRDDTLKGYLDCLRPVLSPFMTDAEQSDSRAKRPPLRSSNLAS